ncbi:MAG: hypothetical protein V1792_12335 [Pseudomonadota bacterium]
MAVQLKTRGVGVVLRGVFNPLIFQPAWFASCELISKREAEGARIEVIHRDAAVFSTEWLEIRILRDSFFAGTSQDSFHEQLRDLVLGTFDLLSHTPVHLMGLNSDYHYSLPSEKALNFIRNKLAPKSPWQKLLDSPEMVTVGMKGKRKSPYEGWISVQVEPSRKVEPGIYIGVNDHYQLTDKPEPVQGTRLVTEILRKRWGESLERAQSIAASIAYLGADK